MKKNRILLLFMLLAFAGTSLKAEGTGSFMEPKEYIVSLFDSGADIVLLAEDHGVRENLEFVRSLLPELYRHGVYMLGMEFGASEDQEVLDSLLTAPEYDERLARELMYRYNCAWAIKEYTDLYHAAWSLSTGCVRQRPCRQFSRKGIPKSSERTSWRMPSCPVRTRFWY